MKRLYGTLLILAFFSSGANAWWSLEKYGFNLSSHRKISEQAISLVDETQYPEQPTAWATPPPCAFDGKF